MPRRTRRVPVRLRVLALEQPPGRDTDGHRVRPGFGEPLDRLLGHDRILQLPQHVLNVRRPLRELPCLGPPLAPSAGATASAA